MVDAPSGFDNTPPEELQARPAAKSCRPGSRTRRARAAAGRRAGVGLAPLPAGVKVYAWTEPQVWRRAVDGGVSAVSQEQLVQSKLRLARLGVPCDAAAIAEFQRYSGGCTIAGPAEPVPEAWAAEMLCGTHVTYVVAAGRCRFELSQAMRKAPSGEQLVICATAGDGVTCFEGVPHRLVPEETGTVLIPLFNKSSSPESRVRREAQGLSDAHVAPQSATGAEPPGLDAESIEAALAAGDVDAVRKLLSGGKTAEPPPASPRAAPTICDGRHWLQLRLADGGPMVELLQYRVMGKVVWPAAHALAELLLEAWRAPRGEDVTLVEVAAGAGLPSLVAASEACAACFARVVATDFTEEGVQLLRANHERNGARVAAVARLDLTAEGAADELATLAPPSATGRLVVCACDLAYNDDAVEGLFAVAAAWWRAAASAASSELTLLFARSSNFEHTDEATLAAAARHGFGLAARATRRNAAGVQDSSSSVTFVGCQDDASDVMTFEPRGRQTACEAGP